MKATVTATYHAAEVARLQRRITELEEKLDEEKFEGKRSERKLAIAEAMLKNVDEGWPYREYEERLVEERL